jgi:hypothetical protein
MASLNPIVTGTSKRLEDLYTSKKKGKIRKPARVNGRESSVGTFDDKSLNHSSQVLKVDPKKRYS